MSGMVFPQSPAPEKTAPAGDSNPARKNEKSGDSEFDSVSRQEQKRLDRQVAAKRQERADREAEARETAEEPAADEPSSSRLAESEAGANEQPTDSQELPDAVEVEADASAVFTFADLRAMIEADEAGGEGLQFNRQSGLFRPVAGQTGQAGAMAGLQRPVADAAGSTAPGQTVSQLMESMTGQGTAETGKGADLNATLMGSRASAASDFNNQLMQTSQAGQKTADQGMALRSYATSIDVPVGHAEWGDKLVGKLTWLTARNMSAAEIHLTPPDMGPMDVRVQVQHDQASVTVHSANPVVRDQLELHSHRLRDMLNDQGIELDKFDVADSRGEQAGQQNEQGEGNAAGAGAAGHADASNDTDESLISDSGSVQLGWKGEVDLYA